MFHQQDQLQAQFSQEKDKLIQNLIKIKEELEVASQNHQQEKTCSDCANMLLFLEENLNCIIEDLTDWTSNDRESWLIVLSPDGFCANCEHFVEETIELVKNTKEWDTQFRELLDPLKQSLQRINDKLIFEMEDSGKNNGVNNNNNSGSSSSGSGNGIQNNNWVIEEKEFKSESQNNTEVETLEEGELNKYQELETEKEKFVLLIADVSKQISLHKKQHQHCPGESLINQLIQMREDLRFWSSTDRIGWVTMLKVLKMDSCAEAEKFKLIISEKLKEVTAWESLYGTLLDPKINQKRRLQDEKLFFNQANGDMDLDNIKKQLDQLMGGLDTTEQEYMEVLKDLSDIKLE